MTKVKKPENPLIGLGKKPTTTAQKPAEKKPQWAQSKLKKGAGTGGAGEKEKSEKRPDWSARSLKKSERGGHGDEEETSTKRHDWREGLKSKQ